MAVRIIDVRLTPQSTTVGQSVFVEVNVSENDWQNIKDSYLTWQAIKDGLSSWTDVKNY